MRYVFSRYFCKICGQLLGIAYTDYTIEMYSCDCGGKDKPFALHNPTIVAAMLAISIHTRKKELKILESFKEKREDYVDAIFS